LQMAFAREAEKAAREGWFLVANHPFGGPAGVGECMRRIEAMRQDAALPIPLREKLTRDEQRMPEVVLNTILSGTGVHAVIPAMMQLGIWRRMCGRWSNAALRWRSWPCCGLRCVSWHRLLRALKDGRYNLPWSSRIGFGDVFSRTSL